MQGSGGWQFVAAAGLAALALSASAEAATTCAYEGGATDRLKVKMSKGGDEATIFVDGAGDELRVATPAAPAGLICGGSGGPSTMNTDLIAIKDKSKKGNTSVAIEDPAEFAPGASDAGDDFGGGQRDRVGIGLGRGKADGLSWWATRPNYFDVGTEGINPNASGGVTLEPVPDADIDLRGVDVPRSRRSKATTRLTPGVTPQSAAVSPYAHRQWKQW